VTGIKGLALSVRLIVRAITKGPSLSSASSKDA
jgi:hypothetical protein